MTSTGASTGTQNSPRPEAWDITGAVGASPPWQAPFAHRPVDAVVCVPGSKSLTNRYLVLAAIATGPSVLRGPLRSRDTVLMTDALSSLGARVQELPRCGASGFSPDLRIEPVSSEQQEAAKGLPTRNLDDLDKPGSTVHINCGLAGTVMRFVPPLAALTRGTIWFDGDDQARRRPMGPTLEALRALGVPVKTSGRDGLPFHIQANGVLRGGTLVIDASASSQFISALLLVAPRFQDGLILEHRSAGPGYQPAPSPDHIAMTVQLLRAAGVQVDDSVPNRWAVLPGPVSGFEAQVEPDLSNAGPFLAAALVTRGRVRIEQWPEQTTQVGDSWRRILTAFGATVRWTEGTLEVDASGLSKLPGVDFADTSELAPTVAALCALASSPSRLRGISHLRGHETNRLAALVAEINRLGGDAEETEDGLIIRPRVLHGGVFRTYADHRMATAGAILGLVVRGVQVEDIGTTAKTMPEFSHLWQRMLEG